MRWVFHGWYYGVSDDDDGDDGNGDGDGDGDDDDGWLLVAVLLQINWNSDN